MKSDIRQPGEFSLWDFLFLRKNRKLFQLRRQDRAEWVQQVFLCMKNAVCTACSVLYSIPYSGKLQRNFILFFSLFIGENDSWGSQKSHGKK
jgi:hypothetical protein